MPAARGVKRTASKSAASTASTAPKNKKKRTVFQLEIQKAPTRLGHVLTCGQGDVGQLGLGEDVVETTKFQYVSGLGKKIVDACAGGMHTMALDSDGKVWTFGCNDEGALGRVTSGDTDEGTPKTVDLPSPAVAISAGDSHSAALLDNGDVYAWGSFRDSHGSMGLVVRGREGKACQAPLRLDIGEGAVAIASGGDHLVVLSTTGAVYTMGCGEQGQLGRLSQRFASREARQGFSALLTPSKVTLKFSVSRIWAGYHATFALDANNDKMFAWGLNNYGQLGITGEKSKTALFSPKECDAFTARGESWAGVAVGQHHSLALDSEGKLYAVGRCEYGRLGLGERTGDAEALEPIPSLQNKKCVSIAAGTSNSFAITDTGEVLAWGMGSEGQLGTGKSADASEPTPAVLGAAPAADRKPSHISAGGQHTVILAVDLTPQKVDSSTPEKEVAEEKMEEDKEEEEEEVAKKPKSKRQKKQEQEEEISSTSSAQPSEVGEEKPQKINGDETKETVMEVDEPDQVEKKQPTEEQKPETDEKTDDSTTDKPETTDTSSQETTDSESKPDKETDANNEPKEVNGSPENEVVEAKTVDAITANTLTTTA